jgi:uncharacterized protein with PIN domain
MNRQQRREAAKNGENPELQDKMVLFGKLGDKCNSCSKPFDKKSKEHATTWTVFVYNERQEVKLYCPECRANIQAWAEDLVNEKE